MSKSVGHPHPPFVVNRSKDFSFEVYQTFQIHGGGTATITIILSRRHNRHSTSVTHIHRLSSTGQRISRLNRTFQIIFIFNTGLLHGGGTLRLQLFYLVVIIDTFYIKPDY